MPALLKPLPGVNNSKSIMVRSMLGCVLAGIISTHIVYGQDNAPFLKGKLNLSITQGTMECEFTLTDIPKLEDYFIRINSGMNIRYFKSIPQTYPFYYDKSFYDTLSTGETIAYFFPRNGGKEKYLPSSITFSYVGKYPVFHDSLKDYSAEDWKGNISFNGYSVRTDGRQSAWYPVLYDVKKDFKFDRLRYEIEVNCADCSSIYLNGSTPVSGQRAVFKSDIPQEIALFAGKYKISKQDGTYVLNPDITDKEISELGKITNEIKKYYETKLAIPYKESITYIQTTPTSASNAWLFVSYPSIFNIGRGEYSMKSFFDKKKSEWYKSYLAHELGHYYFGSYRRFNSELGDMLNEGLSEYLSFKATKDLTSDSVYKKLIEKKASAVKSFHAIPFAKIKSHSDYQNRELYVYYYAPLLFTAIEKEIGEANTWKWLKLLLETNADFTNYSFIEQTISLVIHDKNKLDLIKSKYFYSDQAIENVIETIAFK
jgi:hypothetical protein